MSTQKPVNNDFHDGHVYRWIQYENLYYLAVIDSGALWLYMLGEDGSQRQQFQHAILGYMRALDSQDWHSINIVEVGDPPKVKFWSLGDFVKPEMFEEVSDSIAQHQINESARYILSQLEW